MWVASVDVKRATLSYASVGNVDVHLLQGVREHRLVPPRGIVGATLPTCGSSSNSCNRAGCC